MYVCMLWAFGDVHFLGGGVRGEEGGGSTEYKAYICTGKYG